MSRPVFCHGRGSVGCEVAKALGLDPAQVRKVSIDFNAGEIVIARVELLPTETQCLGLAQVLKKYELHERKEAE